MAKMKNAARADGRLQSKVYIGTDKDGKKKYKYVYATTQRELADKVQEVKQKLGKGIDIAAERDSFESWGKRWLKKKSSKVCENWYKALEINYSKLEPLFSMPISAIRRVYLEELLIDLQSDGYSERVMKSVKDIASGIMEMCAENRAIEYNPFQHVEIPDAEESGKEPRRALTDEERLWIEDTPNRAQTAAMIMMYAGLRRGELIPLTWSDIDLQNGTITITKSVEMIDGHPALKKGGKSDAATRVVYIPQILIDYLQKQPHDNFLVVHMTNNQMFTHNAWRSMWESYLKDLNVKYGDFGSVIGKDGKPMVRPKSKCRPGGVPMVIPRITAHWLRHTFITLMYLSGVDVLTAAQQAGHSDITVTMDIYTHLDVQFKKKNIVKLNEFLSGGVNMGVKSDAKAHG